jgi:chromate reductase
VNILAISGSLQEVSTNRALLAAARDLVPAGMTVSEYRGIESLPHFNPDLDRDGGPPEIAEFRALMQTADGVLIASPEYAYGMAGSLKDALDWLVGSGSLYEKPVAVLSAAPSAGRGTNARADLERTLGGQGARVIASATIVVPRDRAHEIASDAETRNQLVAILDAFATATPA